MTTSGDTDYTTFDAVDDHGADYFVRFLDARTTIAGEVRVKQIITDELQLRDGLSVLDIGCGTGTDTCLVAEAIGPQGSAVGLDSSAQMIEESRRRASALRVPVTFVEGTAAALPFADATFDRCRTERVLAVLPDPVAAIGEMVRVTRTDGIVVVSEIDTGVAFFDGPDAAVADVLSSAVSGSLPNGQVGRRLHRLLTWAGLVDVRCTPHVVVNSVAFMRLVLDAQARRLVADGELTAEQVAQFWADQERGEAEGWLCSGVVCFTVAGRKPGGLGPV